MLMAGFYLYYQRRMLNVVWGKEREREREREREKEGRRGREGVPGGFDGFLFVRKGRPDFFWDVIGP